MTDTWKEACVSGTITKEEYREVIEHLRAGRKAAAELSAIKRASKGKGKRKKEVEEPTRNFSEPPLSNSM